uniref:Migration and invasion enhancer 1 n=1 Tax=Cairina moschata TaxID=8855 RepID=A0A8C3BII1_CAIMO
GGVWAPPAAIPGPLPPLLSEPCGFEATYQELASAVREEYPDIQIESRLGGTGAFEIEINGQLVFSKLENGGFPYEKDVSTPRCPPRGCVAVGGGREAPPAPLPTPPPLFFPLFAADRGDPQSPQWGAPGEDHQQPPPLRHPVAPRPLGGSFPRPPPR